MEAGAQPLAQVRRASLSLSSFRRLAWANAVMLVLIVATGATVRLTGSGLGCEHWPGCQPHHFEPKSFHSYVEFSNRVFAFLTILLTLATFVGALQRGLDAAVETLDSFRLEEDRARLGRLDAEACVLESPQDLLPCLLGRRRILLDELELGAHRERLSQTHPRPHPPRLGRAGDRADQRFRPREWRERRRERLEPWPEAQRGP